MCGRESSGFSAGQMGWPAGCVASLVTHARSPCAPLPPATAGLSCSGRGRDPTPRVAPPLTARRCRPGCWALTQASSFASASSKRTPLAHSPAVMPTPTALPACFSLGRSPHSAPHPPTHPPLCLPPCSGVCWDKRQATGARGAACSGARGRAASAPRQPPPLHARRAGDRQASEGLRACMCAFWGRAGVWVAMQAGTAAAPRRALHLARGSSVGAPPLHSLPATSLNPPTQPRGERAADVQSAVQPAARARRAGGAAAAGGGGGPARRRAARAAAGLPAPRAPCVRLCGEVGRAGQAGRLAFWWR